MTIVPVPASDMARWLPKVDEIGPVPEHRPELGPCSVWTAACNTNGYGAFRLNGKQHRAHVVAYEWFVGPRNGLKVLHACDFKRCVRIAHLFLGTHEDNMRDMAEKGRAASGEQHGMHTHDLTVLTEDQVREIHAMCSDGGFQHDVAAMFGISQTMVSHIMLGTAWGHLGLMPHRKQTLSDADALEIRHLFSIGVSRQEIAGRFYVSLGAVDKIKHRRTFRHLP